MRACWLFFFGFILAAPAVFSAEAFSEGRVAGIWLMGQSLCEGAEALPLVTPQSQRGGTYSFARGVRTWKAGDHPATPEAREGASFAFKPLAAMETGGLGETVANGLADHLHTALGRTGADLLVAYAGQGGRFIDELSDTDQSTDPRTPKARAAGGGYYRTSLDDARRAKAEAAKQGKPFAIPALVWMQGEANGGPKGGIVPNRWDAEIPRPQGQEWYRDRLLAYRKQWSDDLRAITGQAGEIPMFTYQALGPAGEAQCLAAERDPHLYVVGPHYAVASALNSRYAKRYGDPVHLSADGSRWFGEQIAKVMRRVLVDKEAWKPLSPRKAWVEADRESIRVEFHVPRPPLVLDTAFLPRQQIDAGGHALGLCGFRVTTAAGAPLRLKAVEIASPESVRIRLAAPLPEGSGSVVFYGHPGGGALGTIAKVRPGPATPTGAETTELLFEGDLLPRLKPFTDEGAFFLLNANARAPIRHVAREGGRTLLRFETRELRNGIAFQPGEGVTLSRPYSYGNLRDSDAEPALYTFADSAYGTRAGASYPLWNWCVLFTHLPVSEGR